MEDNGICYDVHNENILNLRLHIITSFVKNKLSGKIDIESSSEGTKTIIISKN
ncbi:hypothetical protein [Tissierella carlieri]|uniref:hypothetical protein n=1 Tax=Tissierella carlieri TaxID=689904 RepID=UPI00210E1A44|nr:hypothetical protein [Tissierella carlieri]